MAMQNIASKYGTFFSFFNHYYIQSIPSQNERASPKNLSPLEFSCIFSYLDADFFIKLRYIIFCEQNEDEDGKLSVQDYSRGPFWRQEYKKGSP